MRLQHFRKRKKHLTCMLNSAEPVCDKQSSAAVATGTRSGPQRRHHASL